MSKAMTSPAPLPSQRKPRRWLRRLLIGLGGVLVLLVIAVPIGLWGWGTYEDAALARRIEALRQAGEPVTPADLGPPPAPHADNAAVAFRNAAPTIDEESGAWVALEELSETPRLPLTDAERSLLQAVVAANAEALRQVEAAAGLRGADWGITFTSPTIDTLLRDLKEQRNLAQLLQADALLALEAGEVHRGLRRAEQVLAISRALHHHPMLVSHLVAVGVSALVAEMAADAARDLAAGGPPRPDLRNRARVLIAALLDEREFRQALLRAYQHERVEQLDGITAVADGRMTAPGQPAGGGSALPAGAVRAMVIRNASGAIDHMGHVIAAAGASNDWPAFQARRTSSPSAVERAHCQPFHGCHRPGCPSALPAHGRSFIGSRAVPCRPRGRTAGLAGPTGSRIPPRRPHRPDCGRGQAAGLRAAPLAPAGLQRRDERRG